MSSINGTSYQRLTFEARNKGSHSSKFSRLYWRVVHSNEWKMFPSNWQSHSTGGYLRFWSSFYLIRNILSLQRQKCILKELLIKIMKKVRQKMKKVGFSVFELSKRLRVLCHGSQINFDTFMKRVSFAFFFHIIFLKIKKNFFFVGYVFISLNQAILWFNSLCDPRFYFPINCLKVKYFKCAVRIFQTSSFLNLDQTFHVFFCSWIYFN